MNDEMKSEQQIREFLLGRMSGDDRTAFEEALLEDGDFFIRVRLVEEELLESYARGEMSGNQRADFENAFLTTKIRREHVAFNRTLTEKLKSAPGESNAVVVNSPVGILSSLKTLFRPRFAFAAFALLLIVLGGWFATTRFPNPAADLALNNSETKNDRDSATAHRPQQPDSNVPRNTANSASVEPENSGMKLPTKPLPESEIPAEKKTPTRPAKPGETPAKVVQSPVLALVAGRLRSDGAGSTVKIPDNAKSLILRLKVEESEFKSFSIELRNSEDRIVYRRSGVTVQKGQASLLVPADSLRKGDYVVELFGISANSLPQSLSDYQFRVK